LGNPQGSSRQQAKPLRQAEISLTARTKILRLRVHMEQSLIDAKMKMIVRD